MSEFITSDEFARRWADLREAVPLVKRLDELCGFNGLPRHLKLDAIQRMGLKEVTDGFSGMVNYVVLEEIK